MRKLYIFGLIGLAAIIIGLAWADQMTFTTYYPAPYGVYNDMVVMNSLGVGTTEPGTKLHVESNFSGGGPTIIVKNTDPNGHAAIDFHDSDDNVVGNLAWRPDWDALIINEEWPKNTVMNLTGGANVGIGTTSPGVKLVVDTGDSSTISAKFVGNHLDGQGIAVVGANNTGNVQMSFDREGDRYSWWVGRGTDSGGNHFHIQRNDKLVPGQRSDLLIDHDTGVVEMPNTEIGDLYFAKDGRQLWRMFEDEEGLYVEHLETGKIYTFVLKETEKQEKNGD